MATRVAFALLAAALLPAARSAVQQQDSGTVANPIRKVVNMLQAMQKKVTEEGEKEASLYEKFMCYCKTSGGDLTTSIAAAEAKIPSAGADLKAAEMEKVQLEEDLKAHQADRDAAKQAMSEATGLREKEAAAFAKEKESYTTDIQAIEAAVAAISKGMAGGFLQTKSAQILRKLMVSSQDMIDVDRESVMSFLSGTHGSEYTPKSAEVVGILKEMGDSMKKSLAEATAAENEAIANYESLMAAKQKEVEALTKATETKMTRAGELAVQIVQMKNDLSDTEEQLLEDKKFLGDLELGCGTKTQEWEARSKTRAEELVAIAETIKILNDDDALELFKKTLPSPEASFVQVDVGASRQMKEALALVREAQRLRYPGSMDLDFIVLALQGRKIALDKVIKMIDDMVATLLKEETDDDTKKEYCAVQLDSSDDTKKGLEQTVADMETAIVSSEDSLAKTKDELAALEKGIVALDKSVAEATAQRKAEHEEFSETMAANSVAKELLNMAKNRLNKFYNPKLYKPAPKVEEATFVEISEHNLRKEAPPPPPETFSGEYSKSESSSGVIAMLDRLLSDLDKDIMVAETEEEDAQKDYEGMMKDAAEKRAMDSKAISEKTSLKAALETDLESHKEAKASATKELSASLKYIASLHSECDWLLKYYEVRKEARAGEVDALKKAKAVLAGADISFVQARQKGASAAFLRR